MKMKRFVLIGFVAGISALAFTSCAYDPYYSSSSYGGYGDGYGYGGSGFSTSYFVSTGSSRWAYDPYAGAYYDHSRRCYYDPYLNGYYPVGYRPRYVYGSPHPHGWSRGSNYCPPPSNVHYNNLTNYRDRSERYRSLGRSWSNNVRVDTHGHDQHSSDRDRDRDRRGSSSDWMNRSSGRDGDQRSPYGDRSNQRSSSDGRGYNPTSIFGDRSGSNDSRGYTPQRGGNIQPDPRSRDSSQRSEGSNRGGSSPFVIPDSTRIRSPQVSRSGYNGRTEAPRSAPQFEKRSERSGGERSQGNSERGNSDRDNSRKIKGLGEG
jgi:hypothetical protein